MRRARPILGLIGECMVCRGWARPCLRGRPTASCPMSRQYGGCGFAFPPFWVTSRVLVMRRAQRTPGIACGATCPSWRRRGFRCCRARAKRRLRLLVVARHDDGNARYGGLPCVWVVVAIVTEGVFAIHIDFPLLFFDLCHGVEDKTSREA